ncbi:MAG: hypothetical protein UZ17_ACD001002228 [Acidobacteria bacterium OLB17]|nr:MAG: hypothetical protein UZ17_ACD001002228 [Acidobacteria bacterium OLB17]MCZ2389486.1 hypothetical protein [Acidobacteriota bacterium]
MNDTQFEFIVDGRPVAYRRLGMTGESKILTREGEIPLDSVLNPFTHLSFRLKKTNSCRVYVSEVVIEKTRPLFFAAFRPSTYRVFVNGELVAVHEG